MLARDVERDREAEPGALVGSARGEERVEHAVEHGFGNAGPVVAHLEQRPRPRRRASRSRSARRACRRAPGARSRAGSAPPARGGRRCRARAASAASASRIAGSARRRLSPSRATRSASRATSQRSTSADPTRSALDSARMPSTIRRIRSTPSSVSSATLRRSASSSASSASGPPRSASTRAPRRSISTRLARTNVSGSLIWSATSPASAPTISRRWVWRASCSARSIAERSDRIANRPAGSPRPSSTIAVVTSTSLPSGVRTARGRSASPPHGASDGAEIGAAPQRGGAENARRGRVPLRDAPARARHHDAVVEMREHRLARERQALEQLVSEDRERQQDHRDQQSDRREVVVQRQQLEDVERARRGRHGGGEREQETAAPGVAAQHRARGVQVEQHSGADAAVRPDQEHPEHRPRVGGRSRGDRHEIDLAQEQAVPVVREQREREQRRDHADDQARVHAQARGAPAHVGDRGEQPERRGDQDAREHDAQRHREARLGGDREAREQSAGPQHETREVAEQHPVQRLLVPPRGEVAGHRERGAEREQSRADRGIHGHGSDRAAAKRRQQRTTRAVLAGLRR